MANKKDIKGYEGLYEIYDDGRVYSIRSGIFLKPHEEKGYYAVKVSKDGKREKMLIHRLVAIYFIPNPENKPCVDHRDGKTKNNSLSNLRWCTHAENSCNQKLKSTKKSGNYTGVVPRGNKFRAIVCDDYEWKWSKTFDTEIEAYEARKDYIKTNLPEKFEFHYP